MQMSVRTTDPRWFAVRRVAWPELCPAALAAAVFVAAATGPLLGAAPGHAAEAQRPMVVLPLIDPDRGRRLFANKGCVICHSVRGVGGKAAPALDSAATPPRIDILDFVSRMWRGAAAMIELQAMELGYQIELAPDEIADLAGFVGDPRAQATFSDEDIPGPLRNWLLDEPYWEQEWPDDVLPDEFPDLGDGENL